VHAVHPATGQKLPIWVADYVLMEYGTGAIMGVPAHDQRDFEFARQCGLPVVEVIVPQGGTGGLERAYEGEGELVNSGPFTGLYSQEARERIGAWLEERGAGQRAVQYRLRDWCISRQRYWGPPIPIIYCPACGPVAVPEEELPVVLPFVADFAPDGSGKSPLARCPQFARSRCAQCGREAPRETDVSDNFLDSAWYFFRYPSAGHGQAIFDPRLTRQWLPVDMYIGGNEHAVLHLMYARFLTMAFKDMGLIHFEEPFKKFRANGMIVKDGAKMSKSRGNVVNPDEYLDRYGADALRMYLMFSGNFQEGGDFRQEGLSGVRRFLERLWRYAAQTRFAEGTIEDRQVLRRVHGAIHKVTQDLEELHYNTAVPALMELLSFLQEGERHYREAVRLLLQLTAPFAPFITQELWERLGEPGRLCDAPWPQSSEELRRAGLVEWVVQVNGRVRDRVELERDAPREQVEKIVFARPRVRTWIEGKEVVKVVFVPNRLVSIAAKGPPGA
jgi:leucyl-tRNA synthetase